MRQEVRVIVELVYDCDARLSRDELHHQVIDDINRLSDPDSESRVEMVGGTVMSMREEAEIYSGGAL